MFDRSQRSKLYVNSFAVTHACATAYDVVGQRDREFQTETNFHHMQLLSATGLQKSVNRMTFNRMYY